MAKLSDCVTVSSILVLLVICTVSAHPADRDVKRSLPEGCSKIQHEIQKAIVHHKWGLDNLKFQQRLKRHPKYIVTIQQIRSLHEPLVELRCPPDQTVAGRRTLEFHFHETRFIAESVRLFDIQSIFPIHTGAMSVKLKLDPLVVKLEKSWEDQPNINEIYYAPPTVNIAKEHREDSDALLDLEKEIESVFIRRIQPDIQKQISLLISDTLKRHFTDNISQL